MVVTGTASDILASRRFGGAQFEVVDYHWDAGSDILDCQPEVLLRWRAKPYRVKAQGWIRPGERANFGQLMLHPADVPTHALGGEDEDARTLVCRFQQDWLEEITGRKPADGSHSLEPIFDLRHGGIDHAMRRIMQELLEPGLASSVLIEGLGMAIAADIMRVFDTADQSSDNIGVLSNSRLRKVREFVESFDEGCPSLSDIAQHCGISAAHLRRLYKATTGQTLHNYVEDVRVKRAKQLLRETTIPLKVISYKLGFCHPSAFSFAFKKLTGEAPRDFRDGAAGVVREAA